MKKFAAVALVLIFALCLASCGQKTESDAKVLRVGMECAYAPYNWTQPNDSNGAVKITDNADYAYGYDVMMAKYLADQLGYELEIYKMEWNSLPMAVQSGAIDCAIAGQSITSERLETVDFTSPYYYASIYAITRADSPYANAKSLSELAGASCTSQINTVWYDDCLPQIPDADVQTAMKSAPEMWVALEAGACDLVVTDEPAALGACAVYSDFVILDLSAEDFQVSEEEINIGISVKKGNTELLDALNGALATLTVEDFKSMMSEAIELSGQL